MAPRRPSASAAPPGLSGAAALGARGGSPPGPPGGATPRRAHPAAPCLRGFRPWPSPRSGAGQGTLRGRPRKHRPRSRPRRCASPPSRRGRRRSSRAVARGAAFGLGFEGVVGLVVVHQGVKDAGGQGHGVIQPAELESSGAVFHRGREVDSLIPDEFGTSIHMDIVSSLVPSMLAESMNLFEQRKCIFVCAVVIFSWNFVSSSSSAI